MTRIDPLLVTRVFAVGGGVVLAGYGVVRLVADVPATSLVWLACWLVGALVISDLVVSPLVVAIGAALRRRLPDRGRRWVQGFLIMAAMLVLVSAPMIHLQGTSPPEKALLQQDFRVNLAVLVALAGLISLTGYAAERFRSRRRPERAGRPRDVGAG